MTSTSNIFYQNYLSLIAQSTKLPKVFETNLVNNKLNVVSVLKSNNCLIDDFYHMIYFTDNILTTSFYFIKALGFQQIFESGLNTVNNYFCSKVLKNGLIILEVLSPLSYQTLDVENMNFSSIKYEQLIAILAKDFITKHGNGVGLISFESNWKKSRQIINKLKVNKYLKSNLEVFNFQEKVPWSSFIVKIDNSGISQLVLSDIETHFKSKLIYKITKVNELDDKIIVFEKLDHTVLNVLEGHLNGVSSVMRELYQLVDFWRPESAIKTNKTGLNTKVVASRNINSIEKEFYSKCVKFPINEPLIIKKTHFGQIKEFLLFNNGPGIQHIAFSCTSIIDTVEYLRSQGHIDFLEISSNEFNNYYSKVHELLLKSQKKNHEDVVLQNFVAYLLTNFDKIKSLHILVEVSAKTEILLQIFTKPLNGRPCLFLEFIQRFRNQGFGQTNFINLFKSLEDEQKSRNTL